MKRIEFKESVLDKINTRDVTMLTNRVKKEKGDVGTVGTLRHNIFFKIVKRGFIIF